MLERYAPLYNGLGQGNKIPAGGMVKTAKDLMTAPVQSIASDRSVREAAELMLRQNVSCLPVVDAQNRIEGMLSHTDFEPRAQHLPFSSVVQPAVMGQLTSFGELEAAYRQAATKKIKEVMAHPAVTVQEDATIPEVAETMMQHRVKRLPVVRGNFIVGIISRHDLLKLMVEE